MPIVITSVTNTPAKHPHIDGIGDFNTYQAIRLLNDRVQDLTNRLAAAEGTITSLVSLVNTLETQLTAARQAADQALAITQEP